MNEYLVDAYKKNMNDIRFSDAQKEKMINRLMGMLDQEKNGSVNVCGIKRKVSIKKIVALTAACLVILVGCGVVAGKVEGYVSAFGWDSFFSKTSSFSHLDKMAKKVGIDVSAVEEFSNGYKFSSMEIEDWRSVDGEDRTVGRFKELNIDYVRGDDPAIILNIERVREEQDGEDQADSSIRANETRTFEGVDIYYNLDEHLGLPASKDVSPTEEELEREETDDHFFISIGSDKRETYYVSSANFVLGDVRYCLMSFDNDISSDELMDMAEDIIKAK